MTNNTNNDELPPKGKTCIYCDRDGPFNDEHIFCAGLGGDDRHFLLRDLVCEVCNSKIFSALETKFMRSSPDAWARIMSQSHGRKRGKGSSRPKFQPRFTRVILPDGGVAEAEIKAGGQTSLLPQFTLIGNQLQSAGSDLSEIQLFVAELSTIFAMDVLPIVTKIVGQRRARYSSIHYRWDGETYAIAGRIRTLKPPKQCIWRELADVSEQRVELPPKIFRRDTGQTMLRLFGNMQDIEFLTMLRKNLLQLAQATSKAKLSLEIRNPLVTTRFEVEFGVRERVLAKIGLNFAIFVLGETYVRQVCFDAIKKGILHGDPPIASAIHQADSSSSHPGLTAMFDMTPKKDRHLCMLTAIPSPSGGMELIFCARLYGGAISLIRLAENIPLPAPTLFSFMEVDYVNHKIEIFDIHQFWNRTFQT